jgi:hypothetical protein
VRWDGSRLWDTVFDSLFASSNALASRVILLGRIDASESDGKMSTCLSSKNHGAFACVKQVPKETRRGRRGNEGPAHTNNISALGSGSFLDRSSSPLLTLIGRPRSIAPLSHLLRCLPRLSRPCPGRGRRESFVPGGTSFGRQRDSSFPFLVHTPPLPVPPAARKSTRNRRKGGQRPTPPAVSSLLYCTVL